MTVINLTKNRFLQQIQKTELVNWKRFGIIHVAQRKLPPKNCSYGNIMPVNYLSYSVSPSSFCFHSYFGGDTLISFLLWVQQFKNRLNFVYFIFLFINGLKKLLHFLHFKLMITLLVTCFIINTFWKFSEWHIFRFEIKCFYYYWLYLYNKYVKNVVLINHSWISKKWGRVYFPSKRRLVK